MKFKLTALLCAASAMGLAQGVITRARITGGPGDQGKCSIELQVDGTVDVEVAGDQARVTALSGGDGQWRKMDCTAGLPFSVVDFNFNPTGGRGKQALVSNPNDNRGVAVVRIEDPQGGSDTYRFELTWRASNGPQSARNSPGRNGNPNSGSIFDNNNFPNNSNNNSNSNDQVNFRAQGDGYLRLFRGSDDQISDGFVQVERTGRVQVELNTRSNGRVRLTGTVILSNGSRLVANMSGGTMQGAMEILLDARNRVQELAMTGVGGSRFELRWYPR